MKNLQKKFQALDDIDHARMKGASIEETLGEYRDVFERAHSRVSVELCYGVWCTFARPYSSTSESVFLTKHADRETARKYAREWLTNRVY